MWTVCFLFFSVLSCGLVMYCSTVILLIYFRSKQLVVSAMAMMQEQGAVGQEMEADMGASGPMLVQTLEVLDY